MGVLNSIHLFRLVFLSILYDNLVLVMFTGGGGIRYLPSLVIQFNLGFTCIVLLRQRGILSNFFI